MSNHRKDQVFALDQVQKAVTTLRQAAEAALAIVDRAHRPFGSIPQSLADAEGTMSMLIDDLGTVQKGLCEDRAAAHVGTTVVRLTREGAVCETF